jgi:hypothetical protein
VRHAASRRRDDRGQALLELLIASLLAIVMILGVIQIALLFNAQSMVKLAAYNAARSAIVSRGYLAPDRSANYVEMRARGRLAAFLTLLPVIPGLHGRVPLGLIDLFERLGSFDPDSADRNFRVAGFELFGRVWSGDYGSALTPVLDVRFVNPTDESDSLEDEEAADMWLSFDDSDVEEVEDPATDVSGNVIKVVVTWQYPLVVPIANRIMLGLMRPRLYERALEAAPQDPIADEVIRNSREDAQKMPIWAIGSSLDPLLSKPENLLFHVFDRVPIRATYVMRMQASRAPTWLDYGGMIAGEIGTQLEDFGVPAEGASGGVTEVLEMLQNLVMLGTEAGRDAFVEYGLRAPTDPDALVP